MAPAMQPAEIQFAQRLASNEKGIRERAVKKLRQYISVKTQRETGGFSQEELLKIWKGLFYCMWMQDEPLLQEELASTISQLIHVVSSSEAQHLFIQTFWQTVNREWKEIDRLRLDQYYMLIRLFLRQSFEVLKRNGWEESRIKLFLDVLMKEILHPESQSPDGVRFHFIDIYLDELSKVGGKELLADQNLKFIDPFCKIAARTKDHTLVQTIARGVFEVIVHQSPFAPEEIVREHKTRVGDGGLPEVETSENEMTWRKTLSKKRALGKHHSRKDGIGNDSDRAGCDTFEDTGPLLQFDYKAVADRLLEITSRKNTPPFNRKRLSKLIRKFQDLSEAGSTARLSFAEDISAKREDQAVSQGRQKREGDAPLEETGWQKEEGNKFSLSAEERKDNVPRRKRKKKKSSLQPEVPGSGDEASCGNQNGSPEPEARKRQGPKAPAAEVGAGALPSTLGHPPARPSHKRKRLRKKSLRVQEGTGGVSASSAEGALQRGLSGEPSQEPASAATPTGGSQSLTGKRRLGVLPGRGGPALPAPPPPARLGEEGPPAGAGEGGAQRTPRPPSLKLKKRKAQPSSLDLCDLTNQKTALLKKRKKMKEILHLVEHNGALKMEAKQMQALGNSGTFIPLKKKKLRAESDFVKFEPSLLPKPLFFRKAKRSAAISSLGATVQFNKTPSSSKKVTFGLNRNTTAEFRKTDKSLLVSPTGPSRVAFNPEQRPPHGVLKSPSRSPAGAPLAAQRPLAAPLKRRPTAVDFF